ncbi:hypothetical protein [Draconibacterium mangrovi]|uniref:hypothetical protein n=1 Tax=Draconibacterium mangrovi TaxID=2697469 RepID=UPI0013D43091|nr:hypothetical protein [Draconibacterium mangrovi]
MKKLIAVALLFSCLLAVAQEKKLPQKIVTALENKYQEAEIENWVLVGDMYYLDFNLISKSYKSIFDSEGIWIETAENISELDIPVELANFISENFEAGIVPYCEKVETPEHQFIRVSLYNSDKFFVLQCEDDGSNIKIILEDPLTDID